MPPNLRGILWVGLSGVVFALLNVFTLIPAQHLNPYVMAFLRYLFGTLSPNVGLFGPMVAYFQEKMPTLKKLAVLGRDDVFPKATAQGISAAAKKAGLDVVYDQLYAVGTMDHSASLSAIKAARPDWIYMTGYTQDLVLGRIGPPEGDVLPHCRREEDRVLADEADCGA